MDEKQRQEISAQLQENDARRKRELRDELDHPHDALVERYIEAIEDRQAWSETVYFCALVLYRELDSIRELLAQMNSR